MGEIAKKAAAMEGADFLCLRLAGGDPNGLNKSVEELIETVKEDADAAVSYTHLYVYKRQGVSYVPCNGIQKSGKHSCL